MLNRPIVVKFENNKPTKEINKERLSVKARTEPNQTEPTEITEPAQPKIRKLMDNYDYRHRVSAPLPIRTLVLSTSSSSLLFLDLLLLLLSLILLTLHFLN